MHVDGGATREVFLVPTQSMAATVDARLGIHPMRRAYIIRNGRVAPEWKAVEARTLKIAGRSISSLIKSQGIGDLYELYEFARQQTASTTASPIFLGIFRTRVHRPSTRSI
jgi:hypothetical protein